MRKRKPAHLKFKGHMHWRYGYVANASLQNRRTALPIQSPLVCVALLECDVAAVQSATLFTLAP